MGSPNEDKGRTLDWDGLVGGLLSSPLCVLAVAVIGKVWPDSITSFSTWLYSHVDPARLPYGSEVNRHWEQVRDLGTQLDRVETVQREVRKDVIKGTLISLLQDRGHDHSVEVRYELEKLRDLDSDCWVVDAAEKYLIDHNVSTPVAKPTEGRHMNAQH